MNDGFKNDEIKQDEIKQDEIKQDEIKHVEFNHETHDAMEDAMTDMNGRSTIAIDAGAADADRSRGGAHVGVRIDERTIANERLAHWAASGQAPLRVATTDARLATLYAGTVDARGRLHLSHIDALRSPWEGFHEIHRATALGRGPSASAAQRPASTGHEPEEMERRFARMVADWLHEARDTAPTEPFAVFAAPRFLGHLREALGPLDDGIALYRGEFTGLRMNELAAHPTVRLLVSAMRAESRRATDAGVRR
jgi:hypothetical protein